MTCSTCGAPLPDAARFCPTCGSSTRPAPTERRLVTALFCDVVGSTPLGERLDAEVLGAVMGEYQSLARTAIEQQGGTVASFQGDGVVGLFGLPIAHEDDAARAARAGLDLLASLPHAQEAAAQGIRLQARVGIESGDVIGDLAGATSGALVSDVLNTAARLQSVTEPGTVLAGPGALRLLRDQATVQPLPALSIIGKAEPVAAGVLLSVARGPRRPSRSTFVGRTRQLEWLGHALDEAVESRSPVLVTLLGDPGIGKSRLLDAFVAGLQDDEEPEGVTVLRASAAAEGEGASLAPVRDLVRAAAGAGSPDQMQARLATLLAGRSDAATVQTALGSLLGVEDAGTAEDAWALHRLLETLAAVRPVILVIDDLHWAGPALLDLVDDASRWTRGPLLIVCAARPDLLDGRREWGGGVPRAVTMTVGPLDVPAARALAQALIGSTATETDALVARADGNPLFLEQLAAEVNELGDAWDPSTAPTSIRALLEARLDRCSPEVSSLLSVASAQGRRFRLDIVKAQQPVGSDLSALLRDAKRLQLAEEVAPNVGEFVHALVRDTFYRRLPKATSADLHVAIARMLPDEDELAGVHLERAATLRAELGHRDPQLESLAGECFARTGERAFARLDLATSSTMLERAARLLPPDSPTRLEILPDLAVALMESGRADQARELIAGVVDQADVVGSRRDAIRIRLQHLALHVYSRSETDTVRDAVVEGRRLLDELAVLEDRVGLAQGWIVLDYLHWMLGEMAHVHEAAVTATRQAVLAGRLREQVQSGGDASASLLLGPGSVTEIRSVATDWVTNGTPVLAAGGLAALAGTCALTGDADGYAEASSRWTRAIEADGLEWPGADVGIAALAPCLIAGGMPEAAEAMARRSLDTIRRLGDVWVMNGGSFTLAFSLARQGRGDEAAVLADAMDEAYSWMGNSDAVCRALAISAARTSQGRHEEALAAAREAVDLTRSGDSALQRTLALEVHADAVRPFDSTVAVESLEEAVLLADAVGYSAAYRRLSIRLAEWDS